MKHIAGIFFIVVGVFIVGVPVLAEVPIPLNRAVTGVLEGLQNEEQVWICPNDTSIIITNHRDFRLGYRQIGIGRSVTDGLTWSDELIPLSLQIYTRQSDPVMTVNSSGDIIICHLDYNPGADDESHLAFLVSDDCGETWAGPTTVTPTTGYYFEDKQFIACDRTGGPHDGNVYISWTRFPSSGPVQIWFARSTDNTISFDEPQVVGPATYTTCWGSVGAGQFSQPLVGKDGAVYVYWQGYILDSIPECNWCYGIRVNKSTDGGVTWEGDRPIRCVDAYNYVDGDIDVYSQPTTEADITDGPHAGNLYLQWRDLSSGPWWDSDILFMRSLDTGHTWSEPFRVNDDPVDEDVDQFHNWLVCNDEGILVSIWYDQRIDPAHYMFDVFAGYSYDGGETWTSNHRVSSASSHPDLLAAQMNQSSGEETTTGFDSPMEPMEPMAGKIAEYIGVSSIGDIVAAVWTDTRYSVGPGGQDVYSARWHLPLTDPRLLYPLDGEEVSEPPELWWATAWKETEDEYRVQIDDDENFGSPEVDQIVEDNNFVAPGGLADGLYYWRIKAYKSPGGTPEDETEFSAPESFEINSCDCWVAGDVTGEGEINPVDAVYMVLYVYLGIDNRVHPPNCPFEAGDVNCDYNVNPVDMVHFVNYVYLNITPFPCPDGCNP